MPRSLTLGSNHGLPAILKASLLAFAVAGCVPPASTPDAATLRGRGCLAPRFAAGSCTSVFP